MIINDTDLYLLIIIIYYRIYIKDNIVSVVAFNTDSVNPKGDYVVGSHKVN